MALCMVQDPTEMQFVTLYLMPGEILRVLKNNEQNPAENNVAYFDQAAAASLVMQKQMLSAWDWCPEEVRSSPTELSSLFTQTAGTHAQRCSACWEST